MKGHTYILASQVPLAACLWLLFAASSAHAATAKVTYAQLLIDHAMFTNVGLLNAEIHAVAPGATQTTLIANQSSESGTKSDAAVLKVLKSDQPVSVAKDGERQSVMLPLRDTSDTTIGVLSLVFKRDAGRSQERYLERALDIRNHLREITPKLETLFDPYAKDFDPTDNLTQRINQTLLARHLDVNVIAIHMTKAGDGTNKVWGINRPNFLGRNSDEIDTDIEKTGRIVMQVIPATHRMEVHMPLLSREGDLWGTLCTVYFWHDVGQAGDLYGRSLGIMNEVRSLLPEHREALFEP